MLNAYQKLHFKKQSFKKPFEREGLDKGDIEQIYIKLTGNRTRHIGRIVQGLCPFHKENTPSFTMYPETHSATCFACGWSGDTIKMVMELRQSSFKEALEFIKGN